ncbi:DUF4245 domain-containing protein [Micromonospora sp. HUAS LYJ1]|uniref:DUF4245 domain-containing protein n=1 Tax=Micromonospora sp. HUAS LYJ1 TaxID=3061626 RepID=UPI00267110FD|nr:DUF4245 domain-containing protein [Micromonospora sp. HUAS LYJ1]WKU04185.1 DUF4245 domain-containing protein [Micromonospora sp. HUAS LYJ1]
MEAAQPADRVPADPTPPAGRPRVPPAADDAPTGSAPGGDAGTPAGGEPEPALVAGGGPEPGLVAGVPEPALVAGDGASDRAATARPGRPERPRSERSPRDMALSLLVLLVPIALLLAFYRGFLGGEQPTTVDAAPAYEQARAANVFPVAEPTGLGDGWRTVSASFRTVDGGATLRVGYLTPEGRGAQLVQSTVPPERLIPAELTAEGQPQGPADLGGANWQRYTGRGNEQALVLLEPNRTVIVVGDARDNELRELAGALR